VRRGEGFYLRVRCRAKVRGKGELYAVACFVTRVLLLGFVCYSLKFYLKDQG
jgi:hypothetical protein